MSQSMTFKVNEYGKYLQLNSVIVNDLPVGIRMDLIKARNILVGVE